MKKSKKSWAMVVLAGTLFQFVGCNWNRILGSLVDHTIFEFVEPFIGGLTGAVTGETE